jgi:hypothetical protein
MKPILAGMLLLLIAPWVAAEGPDLVGVDTLMEKFSTTQDATYAAHALERCAAHLLVAAHLIPSLKPETESALQGAHHWRKYKTIQRDSAFDPKTVDAAVMGYLEWYASRVKKNQETTGDSWAEDPWLLGELQLCRQIVKDASFTWSMPLPEGP